MKPEELRKHLERLEMTPEGFAIAIGRGRRTVYRWLSGETPIPKVVALLVGVM